jgi:putative transposase
MEQQSARKTFKYKLMPTPEQERTLKTVVWRCRELYNAGLQECKAAWEMCRVCVTFAMQSAQLPAIKEVRPEYREINAQVLQDVLHRLDKTFQAFFRCVQAGEQPGYPRFPGTERYTSFTYPQVGAHGGAVLDGGRRDAVFVEDWPDPHAAASSAPRHAQDGHHPPGSRWLVCLHLVC